MPRLSRKRKIRNSKKTLSRKIRKSKKRLSRRQSKGVKLGTFGFNYPRNTNNNNATTRPLMASNFPNLTAPAPAPSWHNRFLRATGLRTETPPIVPAPASDLDRVERELRNKLFSNDPKMYKPIFDSFVSNYNDYNPFFTTTPRPLPPLFPGSEIRDYVLFDLASLIEPKFRSWYHNQINSPSQRTKQNVARFLKKKIKGKLDAEYDSYQGQGEDELRFALELEYGNDISIKIIIDTLRKVLVEHYLPKGDINIPMNRNS